VPNCHTVKVYRWVENKAPNILDPEWSVSSSNYYIPGWMGPDLVWKWKQREILLLPGSESQSFKSLLITLLSELFTSVSLT